jgi:hypothetical protein
LTLAALGSAVEDMRPINETRMAARWKLGKALAQVERGRPGPVGKDTSAQRTYLKDLLREIDLAKTVAMEAQRIGCMPDEEMARAFEQARGEARLLHYSELIVRARPWWYQESRVTNLFGHQAKLLELRKWCPRFTEAAATSERHPRLPRPRHPDRTGGPDRGLRPR